jgi:hypothetical protein
MNWFYWCVFIVVSLIILNIKEWVDKRVNAWRKYWCKLPAHNPVLRLEGIRLHYECTCCKYQWVEDRDYTNTDEV